MLKRAVLLVVAACALVGAGAQSSQVDLEDANLDVPLLIAKYGYPIEVHTVTTQDGYVLELHRVPHGRDRNNDPSAARPVVFVMHGLISSSADYFIMGPDYGLGYILAEEGFDVWVGNARGNYYSRRHVSLNPDRDASFWTYSWEEIGHIDQAAMVDYILAATGRTAVHYIGHSQGSTSFLVLASLKPEYNAKFKSVHLMAPVAFLNHLEAPTLISLAQHANTMLNLGTMLGMNELFARGSTFEYVDGEPRCQESNPLSSFCESFIEVFSNQSQDQFNTDMLPVIFGHTPAGASLKQFAHYGQLISSGQFRRWSYTTAIQNLFAYGSFTPPAYDLSRITADVHLRYSLADTLTPETDVMALYGALPAASIARVVVEEFTHFDFAWGLDARDAVYDDVIASMTAFELRQPL